MAAHREPGYQEPGYEARATHTFSPSSSIGLLIVNNSGTLVITNVTMVKVISL